VYGATFMQDWMQLVKSLAAIALILTAFGIMLDFIKPALALRRVAAILGIVVMLLLISMCTREALVGHSFVAMDGSRSHWDLRLAMEADAAAAAEKGMSFWPVCLPRIG
jgi:hypothetical protein